MRISVNPADPGYQTYLRLQDKDFTVTLDGQPIPIEQIVTVDEEQSFLNRYNPMRGIISTPEELFGDVRINVVGDRPYSETEAIAKHIAKVQDFMGQIIDVLNVRAAVHDESKYSDEELPHLQKMSELVQKEGKVAFGTPEYEARKALLGPMLQHHYANNDHHPEAHEDGVAGMTLMALVEMFCDWAAAAADRNPDGTLDIGVGAERYEMPPMLAQIFRNTAIAMEIPHK